MKLTGSKNLMAVMPVFDPVFEAFTVRTLKLVLVVTSKPCAYLNPTF